MGVGYGAESDMELWIWNRILGVLRCMRVVRLIAWSVVCLIVSRQCGVSDCLECAYRYCLECA